MNTVLILHQAAGVAMLALAVVVCVWGFARASLDEQSRWASPRSERTFLHLVALSQTAVFACVAAGVMLLGRARADDPLHAKVYGLFTVVAVLASYGYRTADRRANARLYAIVAAIVIGLGVRAFTTG